MIPHFDELSAVAPEIHRALLAAAEFARKTPLRKRDIGGYKVDGRTLEDVTRSIVQIVSDLRFADVESTLDTLIALYSTEPSRGIR